MNADEARDLSNRMGDMLSGGRRDVVRDLIADFLETPDIKVVGIDAELPSGAQATLAGFARSLPGILGTIVYIPGVPKDSLKPSADEAAHDLRRHYQAIANQARKLY